MKAKHFMLIAALIFSCFLAPPAQAQHGRRYSGSSEYYYRRDDYRRYDRYDDYHYRRYERNRSYRRNRQRWDDRRGRRGHGRLIVYIRM
jgi:hypothetical protein